MKFPSKAVRYAFLIGGLVLASVVTVKLYKNDSASLDRLQAKPVETTPQGVPLKGKTKEPGPDRFGPSLTPSPASKPLTSISQKGTRTNEDVFSDVDEKNRNAYHPGMKITGSNIGAWLADLQLPESDLLKRLREAFTGGAENADVSAEALTHWLNLQDADHEKEILGLLKPSLPDETMSFLILRDSLMRSDAMQAKVALALLASDSELIQKEALEQLVILTEQNLGKAPKDWADYLAEKYKKDEQP